MGPQSVVVTYHWLLVAHPVLEVLELHLLLEVQDVLGALLSPLLPEDPADLADLGNQHLHPPVTTGTSKQENSKSEEEDNGSRSKCYIQQKNKKQSDSVMLCSCHVGAEINCIVLYWMKTSK